MSVVNKVVVKNVAYDIEDAKTKQALSEEVTRAQAKENELEEELDATEEELLARIQGTSENSSASDDPFKRYPTNFSSVTDTEFIEALNTMHSSDSTSGVDGFWRLYIGRLAVEVKNVAIKYVDDTWAQTIKLPYKWYKTAGNFGIDNDGNYRVHTYYRIHKDGAWGDWKEVEEELKSAITTEENRAKAEEAAIRKLITDLIGESPETLDSIHEISSWILNDKTGAAAMATQINANANKLAETEKNIANQLFATPDADKVTLTGRNEQSMRLNFSADIPAATEEKAGVMTAEDKKRLDDAESVESINWGVENNLDDYTTEGVYNIKGNRVTGDNMPINNEGNITARLNVLVTESNDNKVVTQVLNLNNNQGGEGNVYIRSQQNGTWKPWGKLQTNVEVGQITPDDMSNLTDNGIYSGVCVDGTTIETFVLIVINNYLAASQAGFGSYVSQLKYAIDLNRGNTVKTRTRDAYGIWNKWSSIGGSIELATNKSYGLVRLGTDNRNGYYSIKNINDDPELGLGIRLGTKTSDLYVVPLVVGTTHGKLGWGDIYKPLGIPINTSYFNLTDNGLSLRDNIGYSATKVIWDGNSNMNNYTTAGIYDIYGERTDSNDNLPITQAHNGASIAARLTVVASTLQPENTEKCVTQFLQLSNRMGGDGNTYIRTYNENNNGLNGWSEWKKQQGMVESYLNTDNTSITSSGVTLGTDVVRGLNGMTENGIYSGIYTDDHTLQAPTFVETFVLIVINDYAVSGQAGTPRRISQLKYATDTLTGQCTVKKRVGTGSDSISWGDWEEIGGGSSEVDITDAVNQYGLYTLYSQNIMKDNVVYKYQQSSGELPQFDNTDKIRPFLISNGHTTNTAITIIIKKFNSIITLDVDMCASLILGGDNALNHYKFITSSLISVKVSADMTKL